MEGVRVLEAAQYTFTPAAGAVMADWGADVIKVEHAVTGDAQRGIKLGTGGAAAGSFQPLMEHPNRGKRSVGLALETAGGPRRPRPAHRRQRRVPHQFPARTAAASGIDVDDVRAVNPQIIYARGSAFGPKGDEADDGGYDLSASWCRSGSAYGATPSDAPNIAGSLLAPTATHSAG